MAFNFRQITSQLYHSSNPNYWQIADDNSDFFKKRIQFIDLTQQLPETKNHSTWGYLGYAQAENKQDTNGLKACRQALGALPFLLDPSLTFYDCGDILYHTQNPTEGENTLKTVVNALLEAGIHPIIFGERRECSRGSFQGLLKYSSSQDCALIDFDSQFNYPKNIKTIETPSAPEMTSKQGDYDYSCLGVQQHYLIPAIMKDASAFLFAEEFHIGGPEASIELIEAVIGRTDFIHLSLNLEVLASPFAPGVLCAEPLGLHPWHIIPALRRLAASGKVAVFNILGLHPAHDFNQITAKLVANLIVDFVSHS